MDDIGGFDRDYQKQKVHIYSGALVYFYNTGNNQYIGIPIQSQPIGQESAIKLVNLIQKYIAGDRVDQYGFNIMELLKNAFCIWQIQNVRLHVEITLTI